MDVKTTALIGLTTPTLIEHPIWRLSDAFILQRYGMETGNTKQPVFSPSMRIFDFPDFCNNREALMNYFFLLHNKGFKMNDRCSLLNSARR